jgi:hypothetical protein
MTYGTGTSPGVQTLKDVAGITSLSGDKKEPINYEPRPEVVSPPAITSLPPPSDGEAALASDWPVDPDEQYKKFKADVAALEAEGKHLNVRLPAGATKPPEDPYADLSDAERAALVKKLAAEAKSVVAVDENGNPIRRYLSEPPVEYRAGDPNAPVAVIDDQKKKKKKHWWQFWASNQ